MSHIEKRAVDIKDVNAEIAEEAIRLMTEAHDFTVVEGAKSVKAMDGQTTPADLVLKHPSVKYDIGVKYTEGKIELVGEFWNGSNYNGNHITDKINDWVNTYYTGVSYGESMVESGEFQQVEYSWDQEEQELVIEGLGMSY